MLRKTGRGAEYRPRNGSCVLFMPSSGQVMTIVGNRVLGGMVTPSMNTSATFEVPAFQDPAAAPAGRSAGRVLPLVAGGLALFGALFVTIGVFSLRSSQRLMNEGVTAPGVVTHLELRRSTSGSGNSRSTSSTYYPWFRFTDAKGQTHDVASSMGTNPASHSVGEAVTVRYLPDHPQEAVIDSWVSLWLFPAIFIGVGCLPEIAAVVVLIVWLRKRSATPPTPTLQPAFAGFGATAHSPLHQRLERSR